MVTPGEKKREKDAQPVSPAAAVPISTHGREQCLLNKLPVATVDEQVTEIPHGQCVCHCPSEL